MSGIAITTVYGPSGPCTTLILLPKVANVANRSHSLIYGGSDNFGPGYAVTQVEMSPVEVPIASISIVLDLLQCIRKSVN